MSTVDIIVPTFNRPQMLAQALAGIQAQEYDDWICWIVEDGHTAETEQAATPFLKDRRFQYLPGPHAGAPAAPRNRGILKGTSPYIAFLDDDDLWLPEKLKRQMAFMSLHPDCVLLGTNARIWSGVGSWHHELPPYFQKAPFGKVPYRKQVQDDWLINSSVLLPRKVLERSGNFNETIRPQVEDYELWLRIGVLGEIWLLPDPLVIYRRRPTPSTGRRSKEDRRKAYAIKARICETALSGDGHTKSPFSLPEYRLQARLCERERDFHLAGPRFAGRLLHTIRSAIQDRIMGAP